MGLLTDKENGLLNDVSLAEARKAKVVYLDLDDIRQYDANIWIPDEAEIEHRMENIREVGLLQPLLVMKTDEGIMLNSGHKEELRAEIASSLIFADLKMPTNANILDNHKAYIQNWISVLEKDPNVLFAAIKDAEAISDYVLSHAPVALKEIKRQHMSECADYVKKSIKEDFEHERISEKEYRYLTRHIDQMGDTMQDKIKGNTTEEKHDAYEELKKMMLAEAGFLVAESIARTDEFQINPLSKAQAMVL